MQYGSNVMQYRNNGKKNKENLIRKSGFTETQHPIILKKINEIPDEIEYGGHSYCKVSGEVSKIYFLALPGFSSLSSILRNQKYDPIEDNFSTPPSSPLNNRAKT
jgi:hypothetical protein